MDDLQRGVRTLAQMRSGRLVVALALVSIVGVAGCNDEGNKTAERRSDIVTATIRQVVAEIPPAEDAEPGDLPVVFVVSVAEDPLSAGAQADVVAELRDDIDVRFADAREEAIDDTAPTAPVKDDGVLVVLGEIPKLGNPVSVAVEIYLARHEHTKVVYTLAPSGDEWEITATSAVPLDAI